MKIWESRCFAGGNRGETTAIRGPPVLELDWHRRLMPLEKEKTNTKAGKSGGTHCLRSLPKKKKDVALVYLDCSNCLRELGHPFSFSASPEFLGSLI